MEHPIADPDQTHGLPMAGGRGPARKGYARYEPANYYASARGMKKHKAGANNGESRSDVLLVEAAAVVFASMDIPCAAPPVSLGKSGEQER